MVNTSWNAAQPGFTDELVIFHPKFAVKQFYKIQNSLPVKKLMTQKFSNFRNCVILKNCLLKVTEPNTFMSFTHFQCIGVRNLGKYFFNKYCLNSIFIRNIIFFILSLMNCSLKNLNIKIIWIHDLNVLNKFNLIYITCQSEQWSTMVFNLVLSFHNKSKLYF